MTTKKNETQIEYLKRVGRYGTSNDPFYNKVTGHQDCCGSTRSYYHKFGCKACAL